MSIIQITTPFNIDIEFEIAQFHKRLLAYIIDFILLIIYMYSMARILFGELSIKEAGIGFALLIILLPMLFYSLLAELWMNGQSIGKKIMKIKVISLEGGDASFGQSLLRWFLRFYEWGFIFISLFYGNIYAGFFVVVLGGIATVICIAITPKNQRLGDLMAGTIVVNTKSKFTVDDTIFMEVNKVDYKVAFASVMRLSDRDINTIKTVLLQAHKTSNYAMCNRVAGKVKEVLKINTDMHPDQFLEKLLEDYNYLATKE